MKKILVLNGSISGEYGNTAKLLNEINYLAITNDIKTINLVNRRLDYSLYDDIINSDIFIFGSGTYWDSWGSPMQTFIEWITPLEGSVDILGKPAGVIITGHSVGAKGILSRLQGVLCTFGFALPPMTGMVITLASQESLRSLDNTVFKDEMWGPEHMSVVINNLLEYEKIRNKCNYTSWCQPDNSKFCDKVWVKL